MKKNVKVTLFLGSKENRYKLEEWCEICGVTLEEMANKALRSFLKNLLDKVELNENNSSSTDATPASGAWEWSATTQAEGTGENPVVDKG